MFFLFHHGWLANTGWWLSHMFQPTPLKNHGVKVSWDDYVFHSQYDGKVIKIYKIPWFQSPPTSYHTISYYIILYHTISYYIILYHTISYYIILYHTISYYIILYHTISYYIILYHTISPQKNTRYFINHY